MCIRDSLCVVEDESLFSDNSISSEAAALFSIDDSSVLFSKNAFETLYPASITKVMTALIAIKYGNLSDQVTVTDSAVITEQGATLCNIKPGDRLTLEQLLYGLMLPSGNDAGAAIAQHMAGSCLLYTSLGHRLSTDENGGYVQSLGLEKIRKYATMFGLGQKTGVEVPEATGHVDSREYRESAGYSYYNGDILQLSIGQGYNFFSPIQLVSYTATLANQGKRMKLSLVDSIYSYNLDEKIHTFEPEVLDSFELDQSVWDTVKAGMVEVSRNGTAKYVFANYPYDVAAKTGTPETNSNPNAVFIAYAPADDPQIAVAVVLEKGYYGYNAGVVAKAIFDAYFFPEEPADPILPNSSNTPSSQMSSQNTSQGQNSSSASESTAP